LTIQWIQECIAITFAKQSLLAYFPYPILRPQQDKLILLSKKAIINGCNAVLEAPTGVGKTIGILAGILDDLLKHDLKLLYVCRTHTQMNRVIEELKAIISKTERQIRGISLAGKHVMCIKSDVRTLDAETINDTCNAIKKRCPYFRRVQNFDIDLLLHEIDTRPMTSQDLYVFAKMHGICPFELQKKLLPHMNVITLSYQYVFNPLLRYHVIERVIDLTTSFIVLDEAHNLPAIAQSITSTKLGLSSIERALGEITTYAHLAPLKDPQLISDFLSEIYVNTIEYAQSKKVRGRKKIKITSKKEKGRLQSHISHCTEINNKETIGLFVEKIIIWGERIREYRGKKDGVARSSLYRVGNFLKALEKAATDPVFEAIMSKQRTQSKETYLLEIIAFDPRPITKPIFDRVYGSISMSGTMQPLNAYAEVVGMNTSLGEAFSSPYNKDSFLVLCTPKLHTKGGGRKMTSGMQKLYVNRIMEVIANTDGNTGIFCSSYDILRALESPLSQEIDKLGKFLFMEQEHKASYLNDKQIREFKTHGNLGGAVLLGVMGGRNSEGQDFPGKEMSSVCIVGVPFAHWNIRTKLEIQYYERAFPRKGRLYAYTIPAIRRAAQAAGRVIRSLKDRGIIIFMDERYMNRVYHQFLPKWLRENMKRVNIKRGILGDRVRRFFKNS
jgi:DNA excision repair protein ERCC-2